MKAQHHSAGPGTLASNQTIAIDVPIEIHDDVQVAEWSKVFGVGADVLREAVKSFGPSVRNIQLLLGKTLVSPSIKQ